MSRRLTNRQHRREARYYLREKARAHRDLSWRVALLRFAISTAAKRGDPLALEIRNRATHPRLVDELDALTTYFRARPYRPVIAARRRVRVIRVGGWRTRVG